MAQLDPGSFVIPAYPGFDVVEPVIIPKPPCIGAKVPEADRVPLLVEAYREAAVAIYKRRIWVPDVVPDSKLWANLVQAAELFVDEEVSPLAWAAWSIQRVWMEYAKKGPRGGKPKPAPLSWVFQPARLEKRVGWFGREMGDFGGGRVLMGDAHRQLITWWQGAVSAIRRSGARDDAARAIWEQWFPDGAYERGLERARMEAERERDRLKKAMAEGKFLWL